MTHLKNQSNSISADNSGSLGKSEPEFLAIGKIGRTHGLQGELWMNMLTDFPERLESGKPVFIGSNYQKMTIRAFRLSGTRGLISFHGIGTSEEADSLKNQLVYVSESLIPQLPEGEYYHHDLIGITAMDEKDQILGTLVDILQTGANDVYVVKNQMDMEKEILIPAIKAVILDVNIETKTMIVRLQEWV